MLIDVSAKRAQNVLIVDGVNCIGLWWWYGLPPQADGVTAPTDVEGLYALVDPDPYR